MLIYNPNLKIRVSKRSRHKFKRKCDVNLMPKWSTFKHMHWIDKFVPFGQAR